MKPPAKPSFKKGLVALTLAAGMGVGLGASFNFAGLGDAFNLAVHGPTATLAPPAIPAFVQDKTGQRAAAKPAQETATLPGDRLLMPPMPDGVLNAIQRDDVFALHSALGNSRWKLHDNDEAIMRIASATHAWNIVVNALDLGADVHARNDAALREAAKAGDSGIVSRLVERGADIAVLDNYPLRIASAYGHDDVVLYLLERGAKPDANMINLASFSATADPALKDKSQTVIRLLKAKMP